MNKTLTYLREELCRIGEHVSGHRRESAMSCIGLAIVAIDQYGVDRPLPTAKQYADHHPVDTLAQTFCDSGATMSAAYRQVAIHAYIRAAEAEKELQENGRGIDLREGFER